MKIKDNEIELKYSLRAIFLFESITKKAFELKSIMDMYLYFYCTILATNPNIELTFEQLIDLCDNDITLFNSYKEWLESQYKKQSLFSDTDDKKKQKKKELR